MQEREATNQIILTIRKATEADVKPIAALEKKCFSEPWSEETVYEDVCANRLSTYIVAESGDEVLGYIGFWCIIDECQINNVAVSPDAQRKHIGTLLLDTALRATEEAGMKSWTLEVRVGNEPAINLYKKAGFREDCIRKKYYENGEDAILMSRHIDGD